jgi:hypothetical protein
LLTRIDELLVGEYHFLTSEDECWFLREYTARRGYEHSETNNLISNLKKEVDRKGRPEWHYKEKAIQEVAEELSQALSSDWLRQATLVPMPPSKAKGDPFYDDRMLRILKALPGEFALDIRELVQQRESLPTAHLSSERPRYSEIRDNYRVPEEIRKPTPSLIALFDDILTTGKHFKAAKEVLQGCFGGVPIVGLFIARTVRDGEDGIPVEL